MTNGPDFYWLVPFSNGNGHINHVPLGPFPDYQVRSVVPVGWWSSQDRLVFIHQFASSPWVLHGRFDPPGNVIMPLRHVCFYPVAVVEDVGEARKFPIAFTASLVFHPRFTVDWEEVKPRTVDESPVHKSREG